MSTFCRDPTPCKAQSHRASDNNSQQAHDCRDLKLLSGVDIFRDLIPDAQVTFMDPGGFVDLIQKNPLIAC
ncbi:hypothetical protein GKA01_26100 [Gluconobacter kanchanaburiensis NBRC 103587]|uniref:Uncharacterized protein n=1 Tax=Gluconobacter kanchanaburiensis NBRC 103587 TaxID=1307948 RepID=A0A511BCU2_9PROT|nr:hypothetical protein AA103587_1936 [Gluconobacter kanchanaburiensis NBRC 103587]GEK97413.1 hypothetical protein GKA01_26100 [Gluconobacter kanchanaburiensis NBRC 103587]